jgi:type IX secretion system PorP/SprF family membrane protein
MRTFTYILALLSCFIFSEKMQAQFSQDFSLRQYNLFLENPAYAGSYDFYHAAMGFRKQWSQMNGSPERMYATFHTPFNKEHILALERREIRSAHHGAGIKILSDHTALLRDHYVMANYAYHVPLTSKLMLSMAIGAGFVNNRINQDKLDFVFTTTDPAVQYYSRIRPALESGVLLYHGKYFVSVSAKQLLTGARSFADQAYSISNPYAQFFSAAGCSLKVSNKTLLVPVLMNRISLAGKMANEAYLNANFDSKFYAGVGMKWRESLNFQAGLRVLKNVDFLYSYGITTSFLYNKNSGNHEFMLRLNQPTPIKIEHPADYW